jgi:hypothetical protein
LLLFLCFALFCMTFYVSVLKRYLWIRFLTGDLAVKLIRFSRVLRSVFCHSLIILFII